MAFVAWVGATTIVLFVDGQNPSIESCDQRERIAALGGVVYVIFIIMLTVWPLPAGVVGPSSSDPTPEELARLYREAGQWIVTTYSIDAFGTLLTIGFFWSLYRGLFTRGMMDSRPAWRVGRRTEFREN